MNEDMNVADEVVIEIYEDYFGFGQTNKWYFPDRKQYIEFQVMNEGQRKEFQKLTNRDIKVNRATQDATLKADPAEERHALITTSVVGWNLRRRNAQGAMEAVAFSKSGPQTRGPGTLEQWLAVADPKLVDDLEFEIRKSNPWMQSEMGSEDIRKELDRLQELYEQALEREKGEGSSSSK